MVVDGGCGSSSHHIVELRTDVPWISDEKTKTRTKKILLGPNGAF